LKSNESPEDKELIEHFKIKKGKLAK
jgi:hypothetical protein